MRLKYRFPLTGVLEVDEQLHYRFKGRIYGFEVVDGFASALTVTVADVSEDQWPIVTENPRPGVKFQINHRERYGPFLIYEARNLAGLLTMWGVQGIDTQTIHLEWQPESADERSKLPIRKYERKLGTALRDPNGLLPPDVIARCIVHGWERDTDQIALSFLQRGNAHFHDERFIEAFYNYFFVIETLYANRKTSRKETLKAFRDAGELTNVVAAISSDTDHRTTLTKISPSKFDKALAHKNVNIALEFIYDTRGKLHHHHSGKSGTSHPWHPARQQDFRFEAALCRLIAGEVCLKRTLEELLSEKIDFSKVELLKAVSKPTS